MTTMTRAAALTGSVQQVTDRTRRALTRRNIYYVIVGVLAALNLYLLVSMFFAWRAANSEDANALAQQTVVMKTAEIAKKPLEGLDQKLVDATADSDKFYEARLPVAYSEVLAELGTLTQKQNVKLTRVQYAEAPVLEGGKALTEVHMDASLTGDYRPLVLFMNSLERDKMFFLISGVTLTGQQSGTVGLRIRLTTYLRPRTGSTTPQRAAETAPANVTQGGKQ
jgi:type IV pilus assembly protein PilO